jgi:MFS family permease
MSAGLGPWYAAFMTRSHGMGTAELGVWLGLTTGLGGLAGILVGGYVIGRWFAGDERGQMRLAALAMVSVAPTLTAFLLLPEKHLALIALIPQSIVSMAFLPPVFVLLQRLVPDNMRATAFTVMMLLANLIGMGVGPLLVGILSDLLAPKLETDALRYAMLTVSFLVIGAAYHFWKVGRTVDQDLLSANCAK